ncbi:uncharacterized protein LOC121868499 [Homarus americanus]|uniref:uncharacterized protein LOC121868499 n=1 Tax=Homarus americanus TaxID=6706 RepID=UPI001C485587|nr:uncharacterized protein LOC121868499 [Homarus americanus]
MIMITLNNVLTLKLNHNTFQVIEALEYCDRVFPEIPDGQIFPVDVTYDSHSRGDPSPPLPHHPTPHHCSTDVVIRPPQHLLPHLSFIYSQVVACVVETQKDKQTGCTEETLFAQLKALAAAITDWSRVVLAFEALWASGTGVLATPAEVQEVLAKLRQWLRQNVSNTVANTTRIIYAGSVSSTNCQELATLKDLDGFLVGSAALKPDIVHIINARTTHVSRLNLTPHKDASLPLIKIVPLNPVNTCRSTQSTETTRMRNMTGALWATQVQLMATTRRIQHLRQQHFQNKSLPLRRCPKRSI